MRNKYGVAMVCLAALLTVTSAAAQVEAGKALFNDHCASCHNINKIVTGPALNGVEQRHSVDWILSFVRSSQTLVKKGDKDAVALYEKFNRIPMPDHPDLTDENIKNILAYIKSESKDITKEKPPFARPPGRRKPDYTPLSWQAHNYLIIGYIGIVMLLVIAMLMAVQVKHWERIKNTQLQ